MIHFKDNKTKSALSTRWAQMTKQEQIIERKKMEIQAKLEAQKQAAALAAQAKLTNPKTSEDQSKVNIFSNDGSFMNQFKALLEKQKQDKHEKEELEKQEEEKQAKLEVNELPPQMDDEYGGDPFVHHNDRRMSNEKTPRDKQRRWSDKGRNRPQSPMNPMAEDQTNQDMNNPHIPPLMQIPVMPPNNQSESEVKQWISPNSEDDQDSNPDQNSMGPAALPPAPMSNFMGPSLMGPRPGLPSGPIMASRPNLGPPNMGPRGPNIGQGPMGPGPLGCRPMGPNMGAGPNMGPGPNMGMGPGMGPGPNMGPGHNMGMGPGPMLGPRGQMPHMPPFMAPPNFPMPPSFMGPNGPRGPCGPMPPNMCGPNMSGPGPNGPMPPFFGPPFPFDGPNPMMGPNGPPNSMMPPNSINNGNMPFMGPRPPFGPNGPPNFGNGNGPPMPFMPPNSMPPRHNSDPSDNSSGPDSLKVQNIPQPLLLPHMPNSKDLDMASIPPPMKTSQVLSADVFPPSVQRAASEVACNGDHWENVLKAIHSQDKNLWFLHNTNSNEYKAFRELVSKMKSENQGKTVVKPEDKYEPEFSLEDDDTNDDSKHGIKEESADGYNDYGNLDRPRFESVKRDQASSQSDDETDSKRERRKKKRSRWSDEPPAADIKPPGVIAALPTAVLPGAALAKIDEEGVKLTTVNRNNQALNQYALTNYGTTNLSAEDWKKCEDNFKLNLLYQDMLKKRQEVERLAAAGKYKYEYDSDEDTAEGTWEHKLRAKEMNATERWADELTKQAAGKHHIGDFLPPEELKKFMEKYSAVKSGKEPDLSDYKEFKLKEDNVGFKMLQKLGWSEGQGLGAEGAGIVEPINKANQPVANLGLGASTSDGVSPNDDEFDAYRKRMMLAYRFRPNPLNNPRRPYY